MKFGKYLRRNMYSKYKHYYLDYFKLRKVEKDEFEKILILNIKRIKEFINVKIEEFKRRINKKNLHTLIKELKHFSEFIRINITGFKKIIKRHDRKTNTKLYKNYKKDIELIFSETERLTELIYKSSLLMQTSTKSIPNNCFIRKTDKYWVHKNNVNTLKFLVLQNLPLFVYNNNYDPETHDTNISSIYFDNVHYDLYHDRLKKIQSSEAIRIRWYGNISKIVFIERKRHEDGWTGEVSKKLRFKLYEDLVPNYISGEDVLDSVLEINDNTPDLRSLYKEIQDTIVNKKLQPMIRTCYKRIAFQLPNDSTVRISLDTDLCMIKEINSTGWKRQNTKYIPKDEFIRFPYAILEVKTQCLEENKPKWILDLTKGTLVEHVHKFSKYLHGMSVLYPNITEIPYWLPQMTTKILKDPYEDEAEHKQFDNNHVLIDVPSNNSDKNSELLSPVDFINKRISIPVRVEPKVFFANERTFLSWVQFAIFLGGIGTAMIGMEQDKAMVGGITLIGVSIVFAFYALYLYLWRAGMIRRRESGPYDDVYGPPILVCVFLFAMFLAVIFKFPLKRIIN